MEHFEWTVAGKTYRLDVTKQIPDSGGFVLDREATEADVLAAICSRKLSVLATEPTKEELREIAEKAFKGDLVFYSEFLEEKADASNLDLYNAGRASAVADYAEANQKLRAEADALREQVRWFVEKAADEKLDGYRELGQRAADAEQHAIEEHAAYLSCADELAETKAQLLGAKKRIEKLSAELEQFKSEKK